MNKIKLILIVKIYWRVRELISPKYMRTIDICQIMQRCLWSLWLWLFFFGTEEICYIFYQVCSSFLSTWKKNQTFWYVFATVCWCIRAGVAKVRPSRDFLRPLCQILDAQLSNLWHIYVWKYPKFTSIYIFM